MGKKAVRIMNMAMMMGSLSMLTACGADRQETEKATTIQDSTNNTNAIIENSQLVYDGQGETLVLGVPTSQYITSYKDNYLTKKLEQEFNINLEFYELPADAAEARTKISLMMSSGNELPDMLMGSFLTSEMIYDYGVKGQFISLKEYFDDPEMAVYFNQIPEEDRKRMYEGAFAADGNIYGFPRLSDAIWNTSVYRYYMNEEWLDTLGLEVPETISELEEVLKAFVKNDPNGNGKQDEIGVFGQASGAYGEDVIDALINSWVFWNGGERNDGFSLDDAGDQVIAPYTTEEWRQAMICLNRWYQEGLIDDSMFTNDSTQFKATLNSEENIVGLVSLGSFSSQYPDTDNNPNFAEMEMIAPFEGPDGVRYTPTAETVPESACFITSACKNPELAFRLADYFYDKDMCHISRWGEEGVDWSRDPKICEEYTNGYVEAGLADAIDLVSLTNIWSEPSAQFWHNIGPFYESADDTLSNTSALSPYNEGSPTAQLYAKHIEYYSEKHPEKMLPVLNYNSEEMELITEAKTAIPEFIENTKAEFITGARNPETEWEAYLDELNNMGLDEWLQAAQKAFERGKK